MPINEDGVGYSEYTQGKLFAFAGILEMHAKICRRIQSKYPRTPYYYIDLNAGVGSVAGQPSSVPIAKRILDEHLMDRFIYAVDINPNAPAALAGQACEAAWGDNRVIAPMWIERIPKYPSAYGLIFHDPNDLVDFDLLGRLYEQPQTQKVDLLIYMSATTWKRYRTGSSKRIASLIVELGRINKRYWIVRDPRGKHQWTFLLGTNWQDFPYWERGGFYRVDGREGSRVLAKLSETSEEARQSRDFKRPHLPLGTNPYVDYADYLRHPRFLEVRRQAFDRAGGLCERCKQRPATEPHHLAYPIWGEFDVVENLLAVCHECHCIIEGKAS